MKTEPKEILGSIEKYGYTINFHDFGQAVFENYQLKTVKAQQQAFFEFASNGQGVRATAVERGETVRSALSLGIISGITANEIAEMKPYVVEWIAEQIRKHVAEVVNTPADPNS